MPTFWNTVSVRSRLLVMAAVFALFASFGLMALQMNTHEVPARLIVLRIFLSGGIAIVYAALAMMRRFKYFIALGLGQLLVESYVGRHMHLGASLAGREAALQHQLTILSFLAMVGIIAAYSLLIHFFRVEGKRYFRFHTEVALAAEIHASLVPPVHETLDGFEIYGASVPSGEVGGDLVDVIPQAQGWTGYVADVSGHGVQSGVLMAMFKTALRGAQGASPAQLLEQVHRTLFPLKLGSMFITAGILQATNRGEVRYASAGHPAILHYQRATGNIREYGAIDLPVGIMNGQNFSESSFQCGPGDILLVLTDGFTEVFDSHQNERGLDEFRSDFLRLVDLPLEEIFTQLRACALKFGPQQDDQTMLLARYSG
jgi:sigma-B regulation protein RsbU (phosphoserine phosphatase)